MRVGDDNDDAQEHNIKQGFCKTYFIPKYEELRQSKKLI